MKKYSNLHQIDHSQYIHLVKDVFKTIPQRYDLLNHLLSLGQDLVWRWFTIKQIRLPHIKRLLDIAAGTGDLSFYAVKKHPEIQVVGLDFSPEMLAIFKQKIRARFLSEKIQIVNGDALALPFPDHSFDAVIIGFGIRNIPDKVQALNEMQRVVVPGGRILVLEMGLPLIPVLKSFYLLYLQYVIPGIARLFSSNPQAYDYLATSIRDFPKPRDFMHIMQQTGLRNLRIHALTLGITYLFIGNKTKLG